MKKLLWLSLLLANIMIGQQTTPLSLSKNISERIMKETKFEFDEVDQKTASDLQVIDFKTGIKNKFKKIGFAASQINLKEEKDLSFGISYSSPIKVWVNDRLVFQSKGKIIFRFSEIAYSIFSFQDTFKVKLGKGINNIVIGTSQTESAKIYIRELTAPEQSLQSQFLCFDSEAKKFTWPWSYFDKENNKEIPVAITYPQKSFVDSLFNKTLNKNLLLNTPAPLHIKKLVQDPTNTFKKDSYADWNYPNGALMMSILKLSDVTRDKTYYNFVKKYCDFTIDNLPLVKKQYYQNHDLHGSYYRIFRKCMLDDTGSPTLPFVELALINKDKKYNSLINEMVEYIMNRQARLKDGTLCRPEPEEWTIWADDLFMSVPLIVKYGALYHKQKYFDEAAKQIINFNKYLFDEKAGLYKHGWFSRSNERSKIFWGRANGWIIWAESEALKYISRNHSSYKTIESIFKKHLEGLLTYQDKSGMWHQILDDKSSFEESSCTAMFIVGLSNAIIEGLVDNKYSANVLNAWEALQKNISKDGIVKDICCGTGMGFNETFYKTRERFDNDPRGVGSIITAGIEVDRLKKYLMKINNN